MEKITSKNNNIIKDTKKLLSSSKLRKERGLFVLEGARLCFDVLKSFYTLDTLLVTESLYERYSREVDSLIAIADKSFLISDDVSSKLGETPNPQGIFAVCKMMDTSTNITDGKYVALDNVQDPSNVGAIIRTAEAVGIDGVITYKCCDIFNPKTLRASMGSILRMKIIDTASLLDTFDELKGEGYSIYSSVPDTSATRVTDIDFSSKTVTVIGNEANGVEQSVLDASDGIFTIPMHGRVESLNASAAASIIMWEMVR